MILGILASTSIVSAKETEQSIENNSIENIETTYNIDYKDPNYDWDEISHIEVVYTNGNDHFIKTAIENGVDV